MTKEYLLKKELDVALEHAVEILEESGSKLLVTRKDIERSLASHIRSMANWSKKVSFSDLKKAKYTTDIYVELDLFVYPRRVRMQPNEVIKSIPLKNLFDQGTKHLVLLGQPGAGKTTSMKFLCQLLFHDEDFQSERFSLPIIIKFRELNNLKRKPESSIIVDQIYDILGFEVELAKQLRESKDTKDADARRSIKEKLVLNTLNELRILLILDGFDELSQFDARRDAIIAITTFATHLNNSTMVVTSRSGDFVYDIANTIQYEISPLNKEQVAQFASQWLNDEHKASDLLEKIYESPFADTAIRPLTLAHLCAIYERIGKIPDKPKTVYRKIINLLLEEWDQQRSVRRTSRYANFEVDRKFEFLSHLAYELTTWLQQTVFSKEDLLKIYKEIHGDYGLKITEAKQVVSELETHTGLFLQSGYDQYEFAHKSLQEFLTAEYLVKLASIPNNETILSKLPNELAIAVTISSSQSDYFSKLITDRLSNVALHKDFIKAFLSRLLIEKPDFNTAPNVGLAVVLLYSLYLELNVFKGDQLDLFYTDNLISEFEKIIKLILQRNSTDVIKNVYEIALTYEMRDGDPILFMKRRAEFEGLSLKITDNLPATIYVKNSFINT
jgi:hypothetical protein